MNNDENFKENVRLSFKKAREDILKLENLMVSLKKDIEQFKAKLQELPIKSSTGNEGVLNKQTNKQTVKQLNTSTLIEHSNTLTQLNVDIEGHFKALTKQEFLVFLSLYQIEEEIGPVRFIDLSRHLNLSESCIRGYINRLIDKGSPIIKAKINNKVINLSLSPEFRALNLKNKLSQLYYQSDTSQKRLFDTF